MKKGRMLHIQKYIKNYGLSSKSRHIALNDIHDLKQTIGILGLKHTLLAKMGNILYFGCKIIFCTPVDTLWYTLSGTGEEYFVIWTQIEMCFKADTVLRSQWNAKYFYILVKNINLIWFEYTDINILINPFTANPGY